MSGGDATSRGHLNADDGADGRDPTQGDIGAAGARQHATREYTLEQDLRADLERIGGNPETGVVEVGGNRPLMVEIEHPRIRALILLAIENPGAYVERHFRASYGKPDPESEAEWRVRAVVAALGGKP